MLTLREVDENGFKGKNRDWNRAEYLKQWRENWSDICNEKLQHKGFLERIDHKTLEAQGIDREPTIHIGVQGKALERKGIITERVRRNREIIERNKARDPQNIAQNMHKLKENYITLEKEVHTLQGAISESGREMNDFRVQAEEIIERARNIKSMKERLQRLKNERHKMGAFDRKTDVDSQIKQLEQSHNQAANYFNREYKIIPEQSQTEVTRLEIKAESKRHLQEKLQDKIKPLIEQKELTLLQYQRQKLLIEINRNKEQIYKRLYELEKESQVYKNLVKDDLLRVRSERLLDTINERNFAEIMKSIDKEQAEKLIKWQENRAREHERIRYR